jgi:hypothetical protein
MRCKQNECTRRSCPGSAERASEEQLPKLNMRVRFPSSAPHRPAAMPTKVGSFDAHVPRPYPELRVSYREIAKAPPVPRRR